MSDTLLRALDLVEPGDLVQYHGSVTDSHGLYLAYPCTCPACMSADKVGETDTRYELYDPWLERDGLLVRVLVCASRPSLTRSTATN